MIHRSNLRCNLQGARRLTFSLTMCDFLLQCFVLFFCIWSYIYCIDTCSHIAQLSIFITAHGTTPSQVRNHHSQINQEAHLERALAFTAAGNLQCLSNVSLPIICDLCIILGTTIIVDILNQAGWWYWPQKWVSKWWYWRVHLIIWHWRRQFRSPGRGTLCRAGLPGHIIINYKGSIANSVSNGSIFRLFLI